MQWSSAFNIGIIITLMTLLMAGARAWQVAEDEKIVLRHRIEVLERVMVSEHPEYTRVVDWSNYK